MSRKILPVIVILLCICLDGILFSRVHFMDIRPDAMMAATVSYAVLSGSLPGALFGLAGGLLLDIFMGKFVGLSAALYLLAGVAGGFFFRKFYADNIIVPALTAAVCGLGKDILLSLVAFISGARFAFGGILLKVVLPGAITTGLLCMLFHLVLKPITARQVKRNPSDRLPVIEQMTHSGKDTI